MGEHMNHLSEEELIEHYYGEDAENAIAERHLKACVACAGNYSVLQRDLGAVKSATPPVRDETYGAEVWQSIRGSLPAYAVRKRRWLPIGLWRPLSYAAVCALLIAVAFVAGREWQRKQPQATMATSNQQGRQRVVVLVLGEHLDRSERLLVELNHADATDAAASLPMQDEARELLAANRLVRQSASQSGDLKSDPALDAALDHLDRLLIEVANEPDGLSRGDLNRIRQEMNTDGLLFDVRVLRSHVLEQQQGNNTASKGRSIS
jgi:hypothetical protein